MIYAIVAVLALILDQGVKYWVTVTIALETGSIPVIKGVLSLVNIHNAGAAFGLLNNVPAAKWLFILLAIVFVVVVIFALSKNVIRDPLGRWTAVLVMAGAIGNCIDRVINGYVVDMFRLEFMNFAVFNIADIFITVCGILFCVYIIFGGDFGEKAPAKAGGPSKKPAKRAAPPRSKAPAPVDEDEDMKIAPVRPAPIAGDGEIRTYQPRPKAQSVPVPAAAHAVESAERPELPKVKQSYAFDPTSPFAEWEKSKAAAPQFAEDDGPAFETVPAPAPVKAAPAPVKPAPVKPAPIPAKTADEFDLDSILAEFSSK